LREAYRAGVEFIQASENCILEARAVLAEAGYYVEHTTAATYAAYLSHSREISGDVLIPLCGAGLKSDK
jgi:threonine synthase